MATHLHQALPQHQERQILPSLTINHACQQKTAVMVLRPVAALVVHLSCLSWQTTSEQQQRFQTHLTKSWYRLRSSALSLQWMLTEHTADAIRQVESLKGTREALESSGAMILGLKLQPMRNDKCFKCFIPDPTIKGAYLPLPTNNGFKLKDGVSILEDTYFEQLKLGETQGQNKMEDIGNENVFVEEEEQQEGSRRKHESATSLGNRLAELGFKKTFDGVVIDIKYDYMVVRTRYDQAKSVVESQPNSLYAMFSSLGDVTYRRQKAAIHCLGALIGTEPEEARVRKVLIENRRVKVQEHAAARASWMTESALLELETALGRDPGMNNDQKTCLTDAFKRTMTLLQGPPGTGKSRTLAAAVKALCRVFHDAGGREAAEACGFRLPSYQQLNQWSDQHVQTWLSSIQNIPPTCKEWLLQGLQGVSGAWLKSAQNRRVHGQIMNTLCENGMDEDDAKAAADQCTSKLMELKQRLEGCLNTGSSAAAAYHVVGDRDMRILVSSDSNAAIDNILMYLDTDRAFQQVGFKIVRVGDVALMDERLVKYSVEHQTEDHPVKLMSNALVEAINSRSVTSAMAENLESTVRSFCQEIEQGAKQSMLPAIVRKQLQQLSDKVEKDILSNIPKFTSSLLVALQDNNQMGIEKAKRDADGLCKQLKTAVHCDVVIRCQVVMGTNTSIGELRHWQEKLTLSFKNPIVLIDEAGQATEPSTLIPLTLGAEWVFLAADLRQLRPTILSNTAKIILGYWRKGGGGGSLYGRLARMGIPEKMLTRQYRMHPAIREFPSNTFYKGALCEDDGFPPVTRVIPIPRHARGKEMKWWPYQRQGGEPFPVAFLDVQGMEFRGSGKDGKAKLSKSWSNEEEASIALRVMLLFGTDPTVKSIVILTPYLAQADLLKTKLNSGLKDLDAFRAKGTFKPEFYGVFTIDGFQGREADVVIVSTVRSSQTGRTLGHVADQRRLNVAITRAKRGLIVVGNSVTLKSVFKSSISKDDTNVVKNYWPEWLDWVASKNSLVRKQEVQELYLNTLVQLPLSMCVTEEDRKQHREVAQHQHTLSQVAARNQKLNQLLKHR